LHGKTGEYDAYDWSRKGSSKDDAVDLAKIPPALLEHRQSYEVSALTISSSTFYIIIASLFK